MIRDLQVALQDGSVASGDAMSADRGSQGVEEGEVERDETEGVEATLEAEIGLAGSLEWRHLSKGVEVQPTP